MEARQHTKTLRGGAPPRRFRCERGITDRLTVGPQHGGGRVDLHLRSFTLQSVSVDSVHHVEPLPHLPVVSIPVVVVFRFAVLGAELLGFLATLLSVLLEARGQQFLGYQLEDLLVPHRSVQVPLHVLLP